MLAVARGGNEMRNAGVGVAIFRSGVLDTDVVV